MDLAAMVTLGSTLHAQAQQAPTPPLRLVPTGCRTVDTTALDGGFRYGETITIAGAPGVGKTLLSYHAIYSHLCAHAAAETLVVDTHGGFEPARLRDVFLGRLRSDGMAAAAAAPRPEDPEARAVALLDRVQFTRAWDAVGVVQAVQEVTDGWARRDREAEAQRQRDAASRTLVVPSSQDEENEGEEVPALQPYEPPPEASQGGIGMVVVDNIANHFGSELTKNAVQGQALLTSLLRSLHHLTRQRRLCTILINSVVNTARPSDFQALRRSEDDVSLFAAVQGKPALGRTLAYLVDQSVLVSRIPRTREDVARARDPQPDACRYVGIFEVLKDRHGTRTGRWAAFDMVDGIGLRSVGPND